MDGTVTKQGKENREIGRLRENSILNAQAALVSNPGATT